MHSWTNLFFCFSLVILFFNPKNMLPLLLSSSSETKLFELHSLPHSNFTFLGDSHLQDNEIALTKERMLTDDPRSAGMVFYGHPISFLNRRSKSVPSFYTKFAFSIQNKYGDRETFGDGLAFIISPNDHLLQSRGYFGLVDSTENKFIAIEFDTKRDLIFQDPDDNHVGLDINSLYSIKLATSSSLRVDLKSGNLINTWIDYDSDVKRLRVFLSRSYLKPKKPLLKVDVDLSDHVKETMFVGFSAATEKNIQLTRIQKWEFTIVESSQPPPSFPPESGRNFANPSESGNRPSHLSMLAIVLTVGVCSVSFIALFGWFCWRKLMEMIRKSEETNNLRGIPCQEIQLSILLDEAARGLNVEQVLNNLAELICVKTLKSSIPLCNSSPAVKPHILSLSTGLAPRTNDVT